jgi:serine/threonine protein phosphatase PrpC
VLQALAGSGPGNEDRFFVGTILFAVADGLGGHAAGEVASALAIEAIAGLDGRRFAASDEAQQALLEAFAPPTSP